MLTRDFQFIRPSREYRELSVLTEIGKNPRVSQRALARSERLARDRHAPSTPAPREARSV